MAVRAPCSGAPTQLLQRLHTACNIDSAAQGHGAAAETLRDMTLQWAGRFARRGGAASKEALAAWWMAAPPSAAPPAACQAVGLATAPGGGGSRRRRGAGKPKPAAGAQREGKTQAPAPGKDSPSDRLAFLVGRFKVRAAGTVQRATVPQPPPASLPSRLPLSQCPEQSSASGNNAERAEQYYRQYIQAGGEPQVRFRSFAPPPPPLTARGPPPPPLLLPII